MGADGSTSEYERICRSSCGGRGVSTCCERGDAAEADHGEDEAVRTGRRSRSRTDIGQAPKGQRRAVLRQLLGLGAYQAASREAAVERASGHEATYQESLQTAGHYDADAERMGEEIAKVSVLGARNNQDLRSAVSDQSSIAGQLPGDTPRRSWRRHRQGCGRIA